MKSKISLTIGVCFVLLLITSNLTLAYTYKYYDKYERYNDDDYPIYSRYDRDYRSRDYYQYKYDRYLSQFRYYHSKYHRPEEDYYDYGDYKNRNSYRCYIGNIEINIENSPNARAEVNIGC
jgi:hypothetical protein